MNFLSIPWSIATMTGAIVLILLGSSDAALRGGEQDSSTGTARRVDKDTISGSTEPFLSNVHSPSGLPRELQGGMCGPYQCTTGAICLSTPDGTDYCECDNVQGWMNDPSINDSWGHRSCVHLDECLAPDLNRCADIPGSCVNLPPGPTPGEDQYKCICPQFYDSDDAFDVDPLLGPLHCVQINYCGPASNSSTSPCLPGQDCVGFIGGFTCLCPEEDDELLESGECRSSVVIDSSSEVCGSDSKPCDLAGQFCEDGTNNCLCREGWIQPAGEGAVCHERQECDLKLDVDCDQTGRGTANAVSECIERTLEQDPRGYRCRCLVEEGFIAAPNIEDGTNCIVAPTTSPSTAPSESVQPSAAATEAAAEVPTPLPFCRRVVCGFGRFCSAERRRCECLRGFIEVAPGPVCARDPCDPNPCGSSGAKCTAIDLAASPPTFSCSCSNDCSAISGVCDSPNNRCFLQGYCRDSANSFYDNCSFTFPTETAYKNCSDQAISIAASTSATVRGFAVENNGISSICYVNVEDGASMSICPAGWRFTSLFIGKGEVASGNDGGNIACYIFDE